MNRLRELEKSLLRLETGLIVFGVLVMLGLASYNVVYRNLLVPLQKHWAHSGPPLIVPAKAPAKAGTKQAKEAGGFGGAFGGDDEAEDPGGSGDAGDNGEPEAGSGDAGGFGGAFGKAPSKADPEDDPEDDTEGQDPFSDLPSIEVKAKDGADEPEGGPPPPGSFAAWGIDAIDAIKLDWIDVFLRQLVIIVSFLGAGLATQRRKHINIDALSKVLPANLRRLTAIAVNALALGVCVTFASAGKDLVALGREHPKQLLPWAEEWTFQLMFPLGFTMLALHFVVRLAEVIVEGPQEDQGTALTTTGSHAAISLDPVDQDSDDEPEPEPEPEPDAEPDAEPDPEPEPDDDEEKPR